MNTIIEFTAELSYDVRPRYNFRSWKYITFKTRFLLDSKVEESEVLSNIEYGVILDNRAYLLKYILNLKIKKIVVSLSIRGVNNKIVYINKYALVTIYVRSIVREITKTISERTTYLTIKVYIIDNLKANILIKTDIITS